MKTLFHIIIGCFFLFLSCPPGYGQMATQAEAARIAENWIKVIVHETGSWGACEDAQIGVIRDFIRKVVMAEVPFQRGLCPHISRAEQRRR